MVAVAGTGAWMALRKVAGRKERRVEELCAQTRPPARID